MFFKKWPPVAILDVQKSLLTISDQYHNLYFCEFVLQNGCRRSFWMSETHFWWHFWPFKINTKLFFFLFYKMAAGAHFGCPKFTFDRISGHFRSIRNFNFFWNFLQNGCRRPFWMSENHFWSHFWPFQINMKLFILFFFTNWPPAPILDVWNWLSIAFLAISDLSAILDFRNSLSIAILAISDWYRIFFSAAILEVRKSLWIAFLTISDRSAILDVRNSLSMAFLELFLQNDLRFSGI